jgi:hypothetical protein
MTSRPHLLRFPSLFPAALAVALVAATTTPAGGQSLYGLMIGGAWTGWFSQAEAVEKPMSTGGIGVQVTIHTSYLAPALLNMMEATLAGKPPVTAAQYGIFSAQGAPQAGYKIGATRIQQITLPGLDAGNTGPVLVGVTFAQAAAEQGKPTTWPSPPPIGQTLRSSYFHLAFDDLDANTAMTIAPMTITVDEVAKGAALPALVLTTSLLNSAASKTWDAGVQKWLLSRSAKNGTLTIPTPNLKTQLLVIRFLGVRVASSSNASSAVTLSMTGIRILAPGSP